MTDPVETGWRIHSALIDWTGKVDTKASFALTLETAILAGVVTLSGGGRALSGLTGAARLFYWAGVASLAVAALFAIFVVRPRLRASRIKRESATNFIYFGHLSLLEPYLVEKMLKEGDALPVISKQLVEMSRIAWDKHRSVQTSLTLAPLGVALLVISAAI